MARVVLAMSGGVDSSVAAHLLRAAGHEVIGVFMRHGQKAVSACADHEGQSPLLPLYEGRADHKRGCCTASDAADARRVAESLEIPFYALNLNAEFRQIVDYFAGEYAHGRTPNPCVMCNTWIKFGKLFDYADSVGAEYVATGHYARLAASATGRQLLVGNDPAKDQSYVLFGIDRSLLPRMLLPVGDYHKRQIRAWAAELGLRVADKKDSQEICFVSSGDHAAFVRGWQPDVRTEGELVTIEGRVVGRHAGLEGFTVGQRRGLGVALGQPYYVVRIDVASRRVVIGPREALARRELTASGANWLVDPPRQPFRCAAKIRYNSAAAPATATVLPDSRLSVVFAEPRFGVAPGQAIVCYDGPRVLGGGWID